MSELDEGGRDLQRLVQELLGHFRNLLVWTHAPDLANTFDLTEAQLEGLKTQAALADGEKLLRVVEILTEAANQARFALSRRTVVEVALLKAARAASVVSLDELIARIEAGSADGGASAPSAANPSSPARVAEAPPAAGRAGDVARLKQGWAAVLERVAETAQLAAPYLKEAEPLRIEGDHVVLGFDPEFEEHLPRVQTPRAMQAIEQAVRHELRRPVGIRFVVEDRPQVPVGNGAPAPAVSPEPPPKKKSPVKKKLAEDPAVKKTMAEFDAEVIEIRE